MHALKNTYFHRIHGIRMVKSGFSWPAFFFGTAWAAAGRVWFPEVPLLLLVEAVLWFLTGLAAAFNALGPALLGLVATIAFAYLRGRFGNRWLAASLLRRGYVSRGAPNADA